MNDVLKIAIPNKGRLSEKIYDLLNKAGLCFDTKSERGLCVGTQDGKYSIIFVRTQDIPRFLDAKVADIGFTGWDIVCEEGLELDKIKELEFGYCKMVVAVKEDAPYKNSADLPKEINVATSFPNLTKEFFEKIGKKAKVIEISGAVEITPSLGLADVVVDITSTGATLKSNNLKIIDEIMESSAVIVARKNLEDGKLKKVESLLRALQSVIDASKKKYLMAHVPLNKMDEIKSFLPGLSTPTVMKLYNDDEHVVVHVVVDADKVYDSIDRLKALGGQGILIMTVDQMVK
jgi:ATP phosphoribosyltransferase